MQHFVPNGIQFDGHIIPRTCPELFWFAIRFVLSQIHNSKG
jgi:hypothetical protein